MNPLPPFKAETKTRKYFDSFFILKRIDFRLESVPQRDFLQNAQTEIVIESREKLLRAYGEMDRVIMNGFHC